MNGEFLKVAAVAIFLAWPAAYLTVHKILAGYPYRVSSSPWVYLAGTALIMSLILFTVNLQTFKAARTDPAMTLRSE